MAQSRMGKKQADRTVGSVFEGLNLDTAPTICVGVFGVLSDLLPREVSS